MAPRNRVVSEGRMSETIPPDDIPIEDTIPEAWWIVAGAIDGAWKLLAPETDRLKPIAQAPNGITWAIVRGDEGEIGTVTLSGDEQRTTFTVEMPGAWQSYWAEVLGLLTRMTTASAIYRRQTWGASAEGAIEHYYRARARGSKITLKDVAEMTGFSHNYLREVKSRYDRAGKWGSKPPKKTK